MPFKKPHHTPEDRYITKVDDGYLIKPRGLNIVWGNDSRYWKIPEDGAAELIQVSWLEVSSIVSIKKAGKYRIKFHVNVKEDGFGWNGTDVLVMAKVGKMGKYVYKVANLSRDHGPLEIPLDEPLDIEVKNANEATPKDLHFGLYEVWSGKWKGGLEIIDAEVSSVP
ncbi:hypothetical protein VNO77_21810 [Canavalia gladiata]|uniref:Protein PHLOEM PROTEIN 2-LIKE A9-like n=1 Tax=Canavalia gladiata TaxID=3824 RepID=A0AAN9QA78_CANGL